MIDWFSFSRLSDYLACPQLFRLKHIDKLLSEEKSMDLMCGTALHLGIHEILSKEGDGSVALVLWDSIRKDALYPSQFSWEELKNCLECWISKFTRLHAKHFEPLSLEERQSVQIAGHEFQGTPDFVGFFKGVPSIVDFKTSRTKYDRAKVIADEQMAGYAHLAEQKLGFQAKQAVYYVFVKDREGGSIQNPLIRELTSTAQSSTLLNIESQIRDATTRKEFYKNTRNCVRGTWKCPGFNRCHKKESE